MITINNETNLVEITTKLDLVGLGYWQDALLKALMEESLKLNGDRQLICTFVSILEEYMLTPDQMEAIDNLEKDKQFFDAFNKAKNKN